MQNWKLNMATIRLANRQRRLQLVVVLVAFAGVFYASAMSFRSSVGATDAGDIHTLLRQYSIALHQFGESDVDEPMRRHFYGQWLTALLDECGTLPPEQVPETARMACLSLANGIGDYALAEAIATDGAMYSVSWQQKLAFLDQRVGLCQVIAADSGKPQDIEDIGGMAGEALEAIRPTMGNSLYSQDAVSTLSVQRIFRVAAERAVADGDAGRAAVILEESASFANGLPVEILRSIGFSWWPDQCLQDAARFLIEDGDFPAAVRLLQQIDGLVISRTTSGEHALLCAGDAVPTGRFHRDFARNWLAQTETWDAAEVRLAYALAFSLSQSPTTNDQQRLFEAAGLLETLLSMKGVLAEADTAVAGPLLASGMDADNWVMEPIRSNALVTLATTYSALRMRDERAVIAGMVTTDYPRHPAVSLMEGMLD